MKSFALNASKKTKTTPIGEIPVDWACVRLAEIVETLDSGFSVAAEDRPATKTEPGVLKVNAVRIGRFYANENKAILPACRNQAATNPSNGCVIISRSNTPELVGAVGYVSKDYPNLFLPDTLWQMRFRKETRADGRWVCLVLTSDQYRKLIQQIASGTSANMKKLQKPSLLKVQIPFPTIVEQSKIADIVFAWDEALEKLDALIEAKACRKQALMQRLLTGRKRCLGFKGKWKKVTLGDVAENISDQNKGRMGTASLYAVTKAEGIGPMRDHVKGESFARCKRVETDWFAYNPMRINIGSIARWQGTETVMVSGDYVVFRCHPERLLPAYLDHLRQSWMWKSFVTRGGNGGVRIRIYFSDLAEFTFPCPPIEEQQHIAAILDSADAELRLLRAQRTALDQQKRGLMQRLLTGKIRVNP